MTIRDLFFTLVGIFIGTIMFIVIPTMMIDHQRNKPVHRPEMQINCVLDCNTMKCDTIYNYKFLK